MLEKIDVDEVMTLHTVVSIISIIGDGGCLFRLLYFLMYDTQKKVHRDTWQGHYVRC